MRCIDLISSVRCFVSPNEKVAILYKNLPSHPSRRHFIKKLLALPLASCVFVKHSVTRVCMCVQSAQAHYQLQNCVNLAESSFEIKFIQFSKHPVFYTCTGSNVRTPNCKSNAFMFVLFCSVDCVALGGTVHLSGVACG